MFENDSKINEQYYIFYIFININFYEYIKDIVLFINIS